MHCYSYTFWESQARERRAKSELGSTVPWKMGLNWFMPALAKSSVGSACGTTLLLGTAVWPLDSKKSRKAARTRSPVRQCAQPYMTVNDNACSAYTAAGYCRVACVMEESKKRRARAIACVTVCYSKCLGSR